MAPEPGNPVGGCVAVADVGCDCTSLAAFGPCRPRGDLLALASGTFVGALAK